jgi:hypothetical protein
MARNDAVHSGAFARHLTRHCIELALYIEEGLMNGARSISDFMVRDPVFIKRWQPVGYARQQMLLGSFSYLPVQLGDDVWHLLGDHAVAQYLSVADDRSAALCRSIDEAHSEGLRLEEAEIVSPEATVSEVLHRSRGRPVLIVARDHLLGIATPFDLL